MPDLIVFPDIDTYARNLLNQELPAHGITGIPVGTKMPNERPARYIRCYTLPGRELCRRTQWVQVIARIYDDAQHEVRCAHTAQIVAAVLRAAPDSVVDGEQPISGPCEKHGPYPIEDPDVPGIPCYQVVLTWTVQSTVKTS